MRQTNAEKQRRYRANKKLRKEQLLYQLHFESKEMPTQYQKWIAEIIRKVELL